MSSSTYFSAVDSLVLLILTFLPLLHRTPVDWKRTTSNCQKVCLKWTFSTGAQHCLCTSALGLYSYFSPLRLRPLVKHFLWPSVTFPTTFWFELLCGILKLSFEDKEKRSWLKIHTPIKVHINFITWLRFYAPLKKWSQTLAQPICDTV